MIQTIYLMKTDKLIQTIINDINLQHDSNWSFNINGLGDSNAISDINRLYDSNSCCGVNKVYDSNKKYCELPQ